MMEPEDLLAESGWQLTEHTGDSTPDGAQSSLVTYQCNAEEIRDDPQDYIVERLGDSDAVVVVDETGFLKQGVKPVGVQRQYSALPGR